MIFTEKSAKVDYRVVIASQAPSWVWWLVKRLSPYVYVNEAHVEVIATYQYRSDCNFWIVLEG